jgi:hypothetical protein
MMASGGITAIGTSWCGITCERADISLMTLYRAEAGNSAIALGTLARILSVLGLGSDLKLIARHDKLGRHPGLERISIHARCRLPKREIAIRLSRYSGRL